MHWALSFFFIFKPHLNLYFRAPGINNQKHQMEIMYSARGNTGDNLKFRAQQTRKPNHHPQGAFSGEDQRLKVWQPAF